MIDESSTIGIPESSIAASEDFCARLMQVLEERQVAFGDDPWGRTGLYARNFKIGGSRAYPVILEEYSKDLPLLRELQKLQKLKLARAKAARGPKKKVARNTLSL